LSRQSLIDTVVSCVPSGWTVNLEDAEVFFLVEVFKVRSLLLMECIYMRRKERALLMNCFGQSVCGIGIVKGYYAHQKFNVMEIANVKNAEVELGGEGRVTTTHRREVR
jgi:tRNA acetyltransferase TAN1